MLASKLQEGHPGQDARVVRIAPAGGRMPGGPVLNPVVLLFTTGANPQPIPPHRLVGAYGPGVRPRMAPAAAPDPAPRTRRPHRVLSTRQQQALQQLVQLGAHIDGDFTARELRTAFRTLARRYHPDRHPGTSEFEKAKLARQFATLHDAYRVLLMLDPLKPAA